MNQNYCTKRKLAPNPPLPICNPQTKQYNFVSFFGYQRCIHWKNNSKGYGFLHLGLWVNLDVMGLVSVQYVPGKVTTV